VKRWKEDSEAGTGGTLPSPRIQYYEDVRSFVFLPRWKRVTPRFVASTGAQ
jgi:hypothetical protein